MSDTTRTAYHEAGHAVMAYQSFVDYRRVSFSSVSIRATDKTWGCVTVGNLTGPILESCEAEAKINYAGMLAESIHFGEDTETRPAGGAMLDIIQANQAIEEYVEHLHGTDDEGLIDFYTSVFCGATETTLRQFWPAVEAVAVALVHQGELTGAEAVTIIEGAL